MREKIRRRGIFAAICVAVMAALGFAVLSAGPASAHDGHPVETTCEAGSWQYKDFGEGSHSVTQTVDGQTTTVTWEGNDSPVQSHEFGDADRFEVSATWTHPDNGGSFNHTFIKPNDCTPPTTEPPPTDVCPNLEGNQEEVPEGLIVDDQGNCVEPPDVCPDKPGNQTNPDECPPPTDVCPNLDGVQESVPDGKVKDDQGNCVTPPPTTAPPTTAPPAPPAPQPPAPQPPAQPAAPAPAPQPTVVNVIPVTD
jgi:hypothetical protein